MDYPSFLSSLSLWSHYKMLSPWLLSFPQVTWSIFDFPSSPAFPPSPWIFSMIFSNVPLCYLSSTHVGNGNMRLIDNRPSPTRVTACHAPGCESAVRWRGERESGREGGGKEKRRRREVVVHCSADKLMQQSRLSQQHPPSCSASNTFSLGSLETAPTRIQKNPTKKRHFIPKLGSFTTR